MMLGGDQRRKSTGKADQDILGDTRLYAELLDGNLYEENDSAREMSSLFENRSISEVANYPKNAPRTLANLRNASNTTVGV